MPIYEYNCKKCDTGFEALVRMDDRLSHACPECGDACDMKISAVKSKLDPISGDFPSATMRWEKLREGRMVQEVKREETGTEDPS